MCFCPSSRLSCTLSIYQYLIFFFFSFYPSSFRFSKKRLSAKMSSEHHLICAVDHSTADPMRLSTSNGYLLGSVMSSLRNLYPTAAFSHSQLSPALLVCQHDHKHSSQAQPSCPHHIYNTQVDRYLC